MGCKVDRRLSEDVGGRGRQEPQASICSASGKTTYDVGQHGEGESAWEATQSNGGIERNLAFHAICPNVLVLERFTP